MTAYRLAAALLLALAPATAHAGPVGSATAAPVFPALTGRVVDGASLLGRETTASLTNISTALEARTGRQFVIVTVRSLNGQPIDDFATALGNHWGVGRAKVNDGVLLVVAPTDRRVRIAVGRGLTATLTDAHAAAIVRDRILPAFRAGHMEAGVLRGAAAIVRALAGDGATD